VLNCNKIEEHKQRKQINLRSHLDNTEEYANQYNEKSNEKKVIEFEVNIDNETSIEDVHKQFKGMHVIDSQFPQNNLTGQHTGKGKIKLRVDSRQEEIVQRRLDSTPNIKCKLVDQSN